MSHQTEPLTDEAGAPCPARLEVVAGPDLGASLEVQVGTVFVGSGEGCDLRLTDRAVSRRHLSLELVSGGARVSDLSSSNGTRYLDARIDSAHIPLGASVELGRTTLRLTPIEHAVPLAVEVEGLIGRSLAMQRLYAQLVRAAPTQATVLVHGESGVGKEAVSRALHALSERRTNLFHTFDCAAVNSELVESALFGHAQGAFTGAVRPRTGLFEAASGSTLMLDEVAAMPLELQPKLLRVLESREFTRVGESTARRTDVRVIATTQRDLEQAVREGTFRSDLYFRLAVIVLEVPPLRDRPEDVPLLAQHFARAFSGFDVPLAASTLASLRCST